jgi:hypothetical protein
MDCLICNEFLLSVKYDKYDYQGTAAFKSRKSNMIQQQETNNEMCYPDCFPSYLLMSKLKKIRRKEFYWERYFLFLCFINILALTTSARLTMSILFFITKLIVLTDINDSQLSNINCNLIISLRLCFFLDKRFRPISW